MNLHGIVGPYIAAVNPTILGSVKISTGYTVGDDYTQVPTFTQVDDVPMDVQAVSNGDLKHIDGLNLNGTMRSIYLNGSVNDVSRPKVSGGDLIIIASGASAGTWLVNKVVEQWDTWVHVICTLQND